MGKRQKRFRTERNRIMKKVIRLEPVVLICQVPLSFALIGIRYAGQEIRRCWVAGISPPTVPRPMSFGFPDHQSNGDVELQCFPGRDKTTDIAARTDWSTAKIGDGVGLVNRLALASLFLRPRKSVGEIRWVWLGTGLSTTSPASVFWLLIWLLGKKKKGP